MDLALLKQKIKVYAKEIGIHAIGFTDASPFESERMHFKRQKEEGWATGFEEPDIEKRIDPKFSLPSAASILAIAIAYPSQKDRKEVYSERLTGKFCASSWGQDYHVILKNKLSLLEAFLKEHIPSVETFIMVDTGALSDRAVAKRAGLGFIGKNGALITKDYGSFVYLGEMLTNVPFAADDIDETLDCGDCDRCIKACPAAAIVGPAQINGQKCLSYVTQKKVALTDEEKEKLGRRLYGCDTCQDVCPKNKGLSSFQFEPNCEPEEELVFSRLIDLYGLSNRQFKEKYGHMAGAWRGKTPIQRNAILIAGRRQDKESYPFILKMFQKDERPVIRESACWALGKYLSLYSEEIFPILKKQFEIETHDEVKNAIQKILYKQKTISSDTDSLPNI